MNKKRARKNYGCIIPLPFGTCSLSLETANIADSIAKNEAVYENVRSPSRVVDDTDRHFFRGRRMEIDVFTLESLFNTTTSERPRCLVRKFVIAKPKTTKAMLFSISLVMILLLNRSVSYSVAAWFTRPGPSRQICRKALVVSIRKRHVYMFQKNHFKHDDISCIVTFRDCLTIYGSIAEEGEVNINCQGGDSIDRKHRKIISNISKDALNTSSYVAVDSYDKDSLLQENDIESFDTFWVQKSENLDLDEDVPRPTENGGYSHTQASRAKISAANKGKTPWNKGVQRTEETKTRIAAGVRAKNRERFLLKLQEMGISEEEYEEQKRKERNLKEAEKRARRTEKGGYRPTEATKRKISEILKQKFAAGEIKPRFVQPINVRRGFTHSEETRQKISESLRKRWATDSDYRAKMVEMSNRVNASEKVRRKISESLRYKWQCDDEFRREMLTKIATRKRRVENSDGTHGVYHHDDDHRARISAAMKAKWQDAEYREKTLQSIASSRVVSPSPTVADHQISLPKKSSRENTVNMVSSDHAAIRNISNQPLSPQIIQKQASTPKSNGITLPLSPLKREKPPKQPKVVKNDNVDGIRLVQPKTSSQSKEKLIARGSIIDDVDANNPSHSPPDGTALDKNRSNMSMDQNDKWMSTASPKIMAPDPALPLDESEVKLQTPSDLPSAKEMSDASTSVGSVDLLKAERRDLYDLLYGDEDRNDDDDDATLSSTLVQLDDENLDTFDPYGLDDF